MKIIGSVLCLLVSFAAFSNSYSGVGEWRSSNGESGGYSAQATAQPLDENIVVIAQTLTFSDRVMNFSVILQKVDDNFYNVLNERGEQVGRGYCWTLENDTKICHSASHYDGFVVEHTIKKSADMIYRIGSTTNLETQEKIIWKDKLFLQ